MAPGGMESLKDIAERMRQRKFDVVVAPPQPRPSAEERRWLPGGPYPDPACPTCGGEGYLSREETSLVAPVRERDPQTGKDRVVAMLPYVRRVPCSCMFYDPVVSAEACGMAGDMERLTLDRYIPDTMAPEMWQTLQAWAGALPGVLASDHPLYRPGLLFQGPPGLAKTHLAVGLGHAARIAGKRVIFIEETVLTNMIYHTYRTDRPSDEPDELALMKRWKEVPLLIIDDVGKAHVPGNQSQSERVGWYQSKMQDVLNDRQTRGRPTILTANMTMRDLGKSLGSALESRLNAYLLVRFSGVDRRPGHKIT